MKSLGEIDFCVVDTETTGGSAAADRVIEVAVFRVNDGIVLEKFHSLINPERPIPAWITAFTGIDDEMVEKAPTFEEIAPALRKILSKGIFTAHNASFDYRFLQQEFCRLEEPLERPTLCTVRLARRLFPDLRSRGLDALCEHLLIDIWDRHRAAGDAEATVYVFKNLLQKLEREFGLTTLEELEIFLKRGPLKLPKGWRYSSVLRLPTSGGTFLLKDANGVLLHKGRAVNLQKRILNIFSVHSRKPKWAGLLDSMRAIEITESGAIQKC
ncbi:MAG: hypothetical protein LHV69_09205 [Elusimicrobia bacterium]|nr:hypothetical protein [Candidatus Obscuribacterium magneticum]